MKKWLSRWRSTTLLRRAVQEGDVALARQAIALAAGANPAALRESWSRSAQVTDLLTVSAIRGHAPLVRLLLESGANPWGTPEKPLCLVHKVIDLLPGLVRRTEVFAELHRWDPELLNVRYRLPEYEFTTLRFSRSGWERLDQEGADKLRSEIERQTLLDAQVSEPPPAPSRRPRL